MGYSYIGLDSTDTFASIGSLVLWVIRISKYWTLICRLCSLFGGILTRVVLGMFRCPVHIAFIRGTSVLKKRHFEGIAEDGRKCKGESS
jgi:hypothetical protein